MDGAAQVVLNPPVHGAYPLPLCILLMTGPLDNVLWTRRELLLPIYEYLYGYLSLCTYLVDGSR